MVKKRTTFILLTLLLSLFLIIIPTSTVVKAETPASTITVSFELRINNKNVVLANKDDVVDVDFIIKRTDSNEDYTTNGFQNEIYYDTEAFEFVENSIICYDTGMPTAKYQDNIAHGKIIQCANMGNTYPAEFKFCSFKLKAIKDNVSGMVYNSNQQIYDVEHNAIPFAEKNLKVMIGIDCAHTTKTVFNQTASTCISQGYETYKECTVCDALFSANDELIASIPYLPLENHTGGTATCTKRAVCSVCNEEYGHINHSIHEGTIVIVDQQEATETEEGYTGDKVCLDCLVVVEKGATIPALNSDLNSFGNVNININGNNNIVGDNNTLTVNNLANTKVLTVGFLVVGILLLAIIILLVIISTKINNKNKANTDDNSTKPTPPQDSALTVAQEVATTATEGGQTGTTTAEKPNEALAESLATSSASDEASVSATATTETETEAETSAQTDTETEAQSDEASEEESNFSTIVKKSFETKLADATDVVKQYYSELKEALLSYKKVKSRVSFKFDSVYIGRKQLAKFVIRGKSLYVYLALDPNTFTDTKYNVSEITQKTYLATPCRYKVNGERKLAWAKELVAELAKAHDLQAK